MIVPTTQAAFIFEAEPSFIGPQNLPIFWGKKPKATTKVTLTNHQKQESIPVQECIPVGFVPSACRGVSAQEGVYTPPSLWTEFVTHACENITFPQLRPRTVKMRTASKNITLPQTSFAE